jgi:type IV pilus assembly protein PilX
MQYPKPIKSQYGMVLVLSMLLLLLLSFVVSRSVNTLLIDEKVVVNQRSQLIAFEAAESALRAGEKWLLAQTTMPIITPKPSDTSGAVWPRGSFDTEDGCLENYNLNWWKNNAIAVNQLDSSYYLIEYYDQVEDSIITTLPEDSQSRIFYRIVAMATGGKSGRVILHSLFVRRFIDASQINSNPADLPLGRLSWQQCY